MKIWLMLMIVSVFLVVGCQEKSSTSTDLEEEVSKNEPAVDLQEEVIRPVVVTLVDPRTAEVIMTLTPQALGYETNLALYTTAIEKIAKELARGTETSPGYDQSMVLDKIIDNGHILKGSPRVILKESELVANILTASQNGGNVALPLYITESNYNAEDIASLQEVTIASFTTYFNASEIGRSKNIELSAEALHHTIVGVGDYFSFNTMVGERTEAKGYQAAPEIINKQLVMGIGGGICQTSSTLFNAVDQVGVTMTERHHHSLSVGYVPVGRDATVSYGTLDFKFQNTSGAPFLIKTFYSHGMLTIEILRAQQ